MNNAVRVTEDTWGVFAPSGSVAAAVVIVPMGMMSFQVVRLSPVDGRTSVRSVVADGLTLAEAEAVASAEAYRLAQGVA